MRIHTLIISILLYALPVMAQDTLHVVRGRVIDGEGKSVEYAAVTMRRGSESRMIRGTATGAEGLFELKVGKGEYSLDVTLLGYRKHTAKVSIDKDTDLGDIILKLDAKQLKSASVTANRVEYNMTGYEYNIGNIKEFKDMRLTDILRTAPGLMVTNRDLTLYGAPVRNVYINRRRIKVQNESLINLISAFKGDHIDKIEVVTDPDISERDPGTSVKITTKSLNGGVGTVSSRVNGNPNKIVTDTDNSVNHFGERLTLYETSHYAWMKSIDDENIHTELKGADRFTDELIRETFTLPLSTHADIGMGYDLTKNVFLSAELSYRGIGRRQVREGELTQDGHALMREKVRDYSTLNQRPSLSLMYEHTFKDASKLTVTGDYVGSYNSSLCRDSIPEKYGLSVTDIATSNNTSTFAGYARYAKRFKKAHALNVGTRFSHIGNEAVNGERSFAYSETTLRPYVAYSYGQKKYGLSGGLQGYLTRIDGKFFADIVPNAALTWYVDRKKGHILRASWSLGVSRPSMSALNPNSVLSDKDIYVRVGNPDLKSYYRNNYGLNMTIANRYRISTSYSRANNAITSYMFQGDDGISYMTYTNGGVSESASAGLYTSLNLFKRLSLTPAVNYTYSASEVRNVRRINHYIHYSLACYLSLPKSYSVSLLMSGGTHKTMSHNTTKSEPLFVDMSFTKQIKNWNLSVDLFDPLNMGRRKTTRTITDDYIQTIKSSTSTFDIQFRAAYNFTWGMNRKKQVRRVESSRSELNSRIGE